jgi:exopolysaccharide biosynthesis polyprenyl glycosylphosphotransferase
LAIAARYGVRRLQMRLRSEGVIVFPTLLIGDGEGLGEFVAQSNRHTSYGYAVIGAVSDDATAVADDVLVVGTLGELADVLDRLAPAVCIMAFRHADHDRLLEYAGIAHEHGASVMIVPDLYHVVMGTVRALSLYGVPLIEISPHLLKPWQALVKRTLDVVVSAAVLLLGMPLWVLIAVAIKLDSPGPVLFTQWRVGRGNRPFKLYKFRSMTHGRWDGTWTQLNDPRVTRVGAIIRRLYLDEIPQFWNVLKGDMSLVGPRPEQVGLVEQFAQAVPYYTRRHVVRPGITGWWQVRRERRVLPDMIQEIRSRLQDDFYYIENMSLRLDVEIIVRTIVVMLRGHGIA